MQHARWSRLLFFATGLLFAATVAARGDTVVLKNGGVYRGVVDQDNTLVYVFDGLKLGVIREPILARTVPDASYRKLESFKIEQPLVVTWGSMSYLVINVTSEPWNN